MTKWNTDDYVGAVNALKSGESVDLGLDFRTDVYYAFVEFFNFSNTDFIKQLKDPDDSFGFEHRCQHCALCAVFQRI